MSRVTSLNLIPSKQALALFILTIASLFALTAPQSKAQFTFAADSASNYGGPGEPSFSSGQNGGTGFSSWNFRIGGNAGAFIGNPGVAGISGLNADSFGLYANPAGNNYIDADRSLAVPMGVGDRLSFLWGVNWDSGGSGAKGFNIYAGGTQLINVNMGGTETITVNGTNTGFGYGTAAMSWSFFYENNNTLAVTASDRDGNGVYSNSFSVSGGVSSIRWYANNLADNNAARQPYFNNLLSTNSGIFSMGGTVTNGNAFRGAGSLAVGNSTTLVIGGYFNDYTGATIISNGSTLRLVAGSIDGWGQTPSSPISNDGTLAFDSGNSYVSGVVSGIGAVTKSGNGMAQLRQNNTYSGLTTIYSGILEAWRPDALGSTNSGTVVMQGGGLSLYGGPVWAPEPLTLSGFGPSVGGMDYGALRSHTGGNSTNTWTGSITLGSNARINSENEGGTGLLLISGDIGGGQNVLYLGTVASRPANIALTGSLSGTGGNDAGTLTSLIKDGASTLFIGGTNLYTGDTRITSGNVTVNSGGTLGVGSDVFISAGGSLTLNTDATVASIQEAGINNGGTVFLSAGATLFVSGSAYNSYMNSISGSGALTKSGAGTMNLYGTQSYTGTTMVSGGKLSSGVALATTNLTVTGGEFEASTANILTDTASVVMNGGQYTLGGNDTIGALSGNGGAIALGANFLTTSTSRDTDFSGVFTGSGGLVKQGSGVFSISGASTSFSGGIFVDQGVINIAGGSLGAGSIDIGGGVAANAINTQASVLRVTAADTLSKNILVNNVGGPSGAAAGNRSIEFFNASATTATLAGSVTLGKDATVHVASGATGVLSGVLSSAGGIIKTGSGVLILSGASANTYSGLTTISAGTLNLNKAAGVNAISGATTIGSGAILLLSASNQVDSGAGDAVTLSGGTIRRGGSVSEVFGNLSLTTGSFLDYGASNAVGNLTFGTYTPSSLLTVQNFLPGNELKFASDVSAFLPTGSNLSNNFFSFDYGFSYNSSNFTITAIPEPSTFIAFAGLLAVFLWPARRCLIKEVKLVLRTPIHNRLIH